MDDYTYLNRKLMWVWDNPDPLVGESWPQLQAAIMRASHGNPLFVSLLSPDEAHEISRLCDAVAVENGHTWRWERNAGVPEVESKRGGFWRRRRH